MRAVRRPSATQVLLWAPVAFAAADLLLMIVNGPALVRGLHHNADVAAGQMVARLYGERGPGSLVILGTHPWYESLWFTRATAWLPGAPDIWVAGPFVFSALAITGLGWIAARLFGLWVGAMAAVTLVCSSTALRIIMFTLNWHGATLFHAVFLCLVLVLVVQYSGRLSTPVLAAIGVGAAAVTALAIPDELSLASSIAPFAGAALILWWRTGLPAERRVAIFAVATIAVAAAVGMAAAHAMDNAGVIGQPNFHVCFANYTDLLDNFEILVVALTALGGGTYFLHAINSGGLARFTLAILTLAGVAFVLRRGLNAARRLIERAPASSPLALAREAYVLFWGLALLAVLVALLVTDVSWDVHSSRYLAGAFLATAALVPPLLGARPRGRLVVAAGVALYAALSLGLHLREGVGSWSTGGDLTAPTHRLVDFARANHLEFGYGGYDDAPVITWLADARVKVFPVRDCGQFATASRLAMTGQRLCPYGAHTISTWYRPRPRVRTFLVAHPLAPKPYSVTGAYARAGRPEQIRHFGSLTVYVYDHDLAADLGPGTTRNTKTAPPCGTPNRLGRPPE